MGIEPLTAGSPSFRVIEPRIVGIEPQTSLNEPQFVGFESQISIIEPLTAGLPSFLGPTHD
ncbi:hypothetical protein [uncultured Metabacillus sp.]|uniref:hypothetical protein n=1 Tax=uncultured Metabacillus sp. TaxID=2860135 RepID=UPI002620CAAB|nr:hypothetical protein [uncultured Metabacillus sp.]